MPPHVLAVVIARAGSKGLPSKNLLPLAGRPMVAWTLDHALDSQTVSRVVLSTDGPELAEVARAMGVAVIERPPELAHDTATVDSAVRHAVRSYETRENTNVDAVAILYGNVPLRPADLTDRAVGKLLETGCDSVQSLAAVGKTHPYWMKRIGQDGAIEAYQENNVYRRQDLPPVYMLDGGVIAVTRQSLEQVKQGQPHAFLGADRRAVTTQPGEVVDIDTALDLRIAEAIMAERNLARVEDGM